ncbi:MAG: hypothetical protein AAGA60_30280 [Cyanobacteria bacterium P01_E01_bin.42]
MAALKVAECLKIDTSNLASAEELYDILTDRSYSWDTKEKEWNYVESKPPSEIIKVRVMTGGKERTARLGDEVAEALKAAGFRALETSKLFPCRPPKKNDYRVYIDCLKNDDN